MKADDFRQIAMQFEGVSEASHMNHPDFRVAGKIFASLNSDETVAMVKLTPEQQQFLTDKFPVMFRPCEGAWGKQGATFVELSKVSEEALTTAIEMAWRNRQTR